MTDRISWYGKSVDQKINKTQHLCPPHPLFTTFIPTPERAPTSRRPGAKYQASFVLSSPKETVPGIRLTTPSPPAPDNRRPTPDNKRPSPLPFKYTPPSRSNQIELKVKQHPKPVIVEQTKPASPTGETSEPLRRMSSHDSGYAGGGVGGGSGSPGACLDKSESSLDVSEMEAEYFEQVSPAQIRGPRAASQLMYVNKLSESYLRKENFTAFLKTEFKYVNIFSVVEAARGYVVCAERSDIQFLQAKLPLVMPGGCSVRELPPTQEISTFYLILKPVRLSTSVAAVMRALIRKHFPVKKIKRISNSVTREKTKVVVVTLESTQEWLIRFLETGSIDIEGETVHAFLLYPNSGSPMDHLHRDITLVSPLGSEDLSSPSLQRLLDSGVAGDQGGGGGGGRESPATTAEEGESSIFSAVERMLVATKTGVHPRRQIQPRRTFTAPEEANTPVTRHVKFNEHQPAWRPPSPSSSSASSSQPPPKPKRREGRVERGRPRVGTTSSESEQNQQRNHRQQAQPEEKKKETPPVNLSNFLHDQEDGYFCKLDGIVSLMKDKPEDHRLQGTLDRVRKENFKRSQQGITRIEPGRNREEEEKVRQTVRESRKREELERRRKDQVKERDVKDTFSFQDLITATAKDTAKSHPPPSPSASTDSTTVILKQRGKRRVSQVDNFNSFSPTQQRSLEPDQSPDLYDECARIVGEDCRDPRSVDGITRSIYSVIKQSSDPSNQTYSQIIVTSSKKNRRPSVLGLDQGLQSQSEIFSGSIIPPSSSSATAGSKKSPPSPPDTSSQDTTVSEVLSSLFASKANLRPKSQGRARRDLFLKSRGSMDCQSVEEY